MNATTQHATTGGGGQLGWDAEQDIRNGLPVILLKYNGDPAGMITLPEEFTQEEVTRVKNMVVLHFNWTREDG